MKGLQYARLYYDQVEAPMLRDKFPMLEGRAAVGLVGEGSECFGFDDDISRDHDFLPVGCIWLTPEDYESFGAQINRELSGPERTFMDLCIPEGAPWRADRRGALSIPDFYYGFTGIRGLPGSNREWLRIPEYHLAAATNGQVFCDPLGEFTRVRRALLDYYPEDVRLFKLAACCSKAAQSGQYNYLRCHRRGEGVAAFSALAEFIDRAQSVIYLLNRRYRLFYKWSHRGLSELDSLGPECAGLFSVLAATPESDYSQKVWVIEQISALIIGELHSQCLSGSDSDFLMGHVPDIKKRIEDPELRAAVPA